MTSQEWDMVFLQTCEAYPAWHPTAETSMVWFKQLGMNRRQVVMEAIESLGVEMNSQFPPSLFQIVRRIRELEVPAEQVDAVWEHIRRLSAQGRYESNTLSPAARFALNAVGGHRKLGEMNVDKLEFVKKDFIRAFNDYRERQITNPEYEEHRNQIMAPEIKNLIQGVMR